MDRFEFKNEFENLIEYGMLRYFDRYQKHDENKFDKTLRKIKEFMEELSEGQKKKMFIAASLITPAHLYIWDEILV